MIGIVQEHPFLTIIVYGIVARVVFAKVGIVRQNVLIQSVYLTSLFWLYWIYGNEAFAGMAPFELFLVVGGGFMGFLAHLDPLLITASNMLDGFLKAATSDDALRLRRSYDKAHGAEVRGDLQGAVDAYREYLAEDRKDRECRRQLAELLLRMTRNDEAVSEFERVLELSRDDDQRAQALFRLAEVHEEQLGDKNAAQGYFERLLRECPDSPPARYAQERILALHRDAEEDA